ncbi:flippase [Pontibacter sp. 13R65]|uniref:flippase n=1 Tax=Pontibacter sp. 13R65 TaxID=3127458 RepID=UPI00301E4CB5
MINRILAIIKSKFSKSLNKKDILQNIGWLFFDKIFRVGLGFVLTAWTARHLGTELFGVWNYAIAFVALFSVLSTLGLESIVVKELVKSEVDKQEILGGAFFLRLVGGVAGIILSVVILYFIHSGERFQILIAGLIAAGFIFQSFDVIDYFFQSKLKSKHAVLARNISFTLSAFLKITLLLGKFSLLYFVVANLIELAITSFCLIYMYNRQGRSILFWKLSRKAVTKLLKESWPLSLASMVILIYMRSDQIMLGNMISNREVGVFSAAVRLSEAWWFIPMIVTNSILPSILASKAENQKSYIHKIQMSFDLMAVLGVIIAIGVTFFATEIIQFIYQSDYYAAAPILAIHTWTSVFVFMGFASSNWFVTENLQKYVFYRTLAGAFLNLILNWVLIPPYQGVGAAYATLFSQFVASYFFNAFSVRTRIIFKMQTLALLKVTGIYYFYFLYMSKFK